MAQVAQNIGVAHCYIYLFNREKQLFWTIQPQTDPVQEIWLPPDQGIVGYVMRTGETVNLDQTFFDPPESKMQSTSNLPTIPSLSASEVLLIQNDENNNENEVINNLLCQPLYTLEHEQIGVVQLINKKTDFTSSDEKYLSALCVQASIIIENMQNFKKLRQIVQTLRTEQAPLQLKYSQENLSEKSEKFKRRRQLIATLT
jgi:GAF domain-containing protein